MPVYDTRPSAAPGAAPSTAPSTAPSAGPRPSRPACDAAHRNPPYAIFER